MTGPTSSAAATRAQLERAAYGWGFLLDDGDLVISAGSLDEVSGRANLEQGLLLRIATPWGTDRLSSAYGIDVTDAFTVGLTRDLSKQVLRLNLIRSVAADPRVASVDEVVFDDELPEGGTAPLESSALVRPAGMTRRTALVQILVQPVSPAGWSSSAGATTAALAAGDSTADTVSFLADVRW